MGSSTESTEVCLSSLDDTVNCHRPTCRLSWFAPGVSAAVGNDVSEGGLQQYLLTGGLPPAPMAPASVSRSRAVSRFQAVG